MLSPPMTSRPRTSWPGSTATARRAAAARHGHTLAVPYRPPPETSGGHSAVARSHGHPPVTASQAETIAASGRARPAADACPDGHRSAPRSPSACRVPATIATVAGTRQRSPLAEGNSVMPEPAAPTRAQPAPPRAHPSTAPPRARRPSPPGGASAPARAEPDQQNPHRCGKNPDHTATPAHAPNPPPALAPARDQAHSAARTCRDRSTARPG